MRGVAVLRPCLDCLNSWANVRCVHASLRWLCQDLFELQDIQEVLLDQKLAQTNDDEMNLMDDPERFSEELSFAY